MMIANESSKVAILGVRKKSCQLLRPSANAPLRLF